MSLLTLMSGMMHRPAKRQRGSGRKPDQRFRSRPLAVEDLEARMCPSPVLLVSDDYNNRVLSYDSATGQYLGEFVTPGSGGLMNPHALVFGPDGNLYVAGGLSDSVLRYDGTTGDFIDAFVPSGSGGLQQPIGLTFGPDGNLYVDSRTNSNVLQYDGTTGAFLREFVPPGSGGLNGPNGLAFGPDGNLYVGSAFSDNVLRYDGTTGNFLGVFASPVSNPYDLLFGPDSNLYVVAAHTNSVERFDGTTGQFIDYFVASGSGGLVEPVGLAFGPDGNLYVSSFNNNNVLRFDGADGHFLNVFASAPLNGGATFIAFTDLGGSSPRLPFGKAQPTPAGVGHRPASLDSLVVFADRLQSLEEGTTFSRIMVQAVWAGLPVAPGQDALPAQTFSVPISASGLYRHALSAQRHPEDSLFAGHQNESSPPVTSDWFSAAALEGVAWDLAQSLVRPHG